ncbi:flagellar motor switch protein FliN/FliY [Desulfohalotomaculum tongense]|uniref:flagellar motor switch phosphatase FliY n=1 Tax=Desulforadius tongensis TaxID=1216062 RepID=UPI0019592EE6|nr:flagellar motor switch phosphatase FliY [Desulforadius tongensis]MBM7854567.1 flagellar motor switch protein FliN/FliY [Desulforadius tongensis]
MTEKLLSQKEIDELFARFDKQPIQEEATDLLTMQELDTISEIGNISMGSAATTLSQLLNHRVNIGYPKTIVCNQDEVFKSFLTPYLIIEVRFKKGLNGFNVLVISEQEVAAIADIMMGGTGDVKSPVKIGEMEMSATTEAMNQMIGASATAMSELFGIEIDISPPKATMVKDLANANHKPLPTDKPVVVARFEITIGSLIKTTFMQITNVDAAREQAHFLMMQAGILDAVVDDIDNDSEPADRPELPASAPASASQLPNLGGVLSVPVEIVYSLGSSRSTVEELAKLQVGDQLELPFPSRQVELLVGGMPVAKGEVQEDGKNTRIKIVQIYQSGLPILNSGS